MLKSKRLVIIEKLAAKKENEAVISFGQCMSKLNAMENQLKKLYQYREDYNLQFNQTASVGLKSANVQDFLRFINNLNHNIDSLHKSIQKQKLSCDSLKLNWIEEHKRVDILSNVKMKYLESELSEKNKQEQRITDESSIAFYLRNK